MGRLNPRLLVPARHLGSPCAADDDLSAAYAARDMLAESWNYADLKTKPLAKVQFARILDLCMNPEMKGMAGAEEGAQQESDMAYVIMLNSDTWW